jgi:tetratricopeptide (TPR) repeat protein
MRKISLMLLAAGSVLCAGAQTVQDAVKEINNENFFKAKQLLRKLQADPASDKSAVNYYLGNAYLFDNDADSAQIFYRAAVNPESRSTYSYIASGRLSLFAVKAEDAKLNFDRALQTSKMKNAEVFYQVGEAYMQKTGKNLAEAIKNYEDAVRLNPKNATYMVALGDAYLENNEAGKALTKYENARDLDPKLGLAYIKIAKVNRAGKIYPDAIAAYENAIKADPNLAIAYKELGETYYLSKQYDKVAPMFKKYVELNIEDPEARTKYIGFLIETALQSKQAADYENVITEATKAVQAEPDNSFLYRVLAIANFELKRYKDGYEATKKFWSLPGRKVKTIDYTYSAKLAAQVGDTAQAIGYFTSALSTDSNNCDIIGEYAKTLYLARRYNDAIAQYNVKQAKCGALGPLDFFNLGRAYYFANDFLNADTNFAQFIARTPTTPEGYLWRGKSLARTDVDVDHLKFPALPHYTKYIEIAGTDPVKNKKGLIEAYQYIGSYYANNNDKGAARATFEKALSLDPADPNTQELMKMVK